MITQPKDVKLQLGKHIACELKFRIDFSRFSNDQIARGQKICDSEVMRYNDNYIRFDTGNLRRSFQRDTIIGSGVYQSKCPYARTDYYNTNATPSTMKMPLTGGLHFERMKAEHKDDIERALIKGMNWK